MRLLVLHDRDRTPDVSPRHADGPYQLGIPVRSGEIDLDLAVTEHVNVGGHMVIDEDDDAEPSGTVNNNH